MKVSNKDKSNGQTKHVCDFCGKDTEHLWESPIQFTGQYCFEHFREMHEDIPKFDAWYEEFKEFIGER